MLHRIDDSDDIGASLARFRERKYKEYFPGETSVPPEMLYTGTQTEILRQNPGAQLTDRARSLPDNELLNEYFSDPNKVVVR